MDTAAHANGGARAHGQLQKAFNYLDSQGINENSAYTSIFYNDQTENVGYWKTNLDTCLKELESLPKTSSMQEQSNVLMRLRESLVTHGQSGDSVRHPDGIEIYPNNVLFMVWGVLSVPGLIVMAALSN